MDLVRRSRVGVIIDILTEGLKGASKTRLMYRANMNFSSFNRYFEELLDRGLICEVEGGSGRVRVYRTTRKGKELLDILLRARKFVSL